MPTPRHRHSNETECRIRLPSTLGSSVRKHAHLAVPHGYRVVAAKEVHVGVRAHDIALDLLQHLCILLHRMYAGHRCACPSAQQPADGVDSASP